MSTPGKFLPGINALPYFAFLPPGPRPREQECLSLTNFASVYPSQIIAAWSSFIWPVRRRRR